MRTARATLTVAAASFLFLGACSSDTIDDATNAADSVVDDTVEVSAPLETVVDDASERIDAARTALAEGDFSTMLQALELSSLGQEIEGRAVTILAPTDDAFSELSANELTDLLANPTQVDDVLKRHIIDEALTFDELSARDEVTALSGESLAVESSGSTVTVDGAVVTPSTSDAVAGEDGEEVVVFGIDRVLLAGS
jgi:uncharacterized surface protein with fasciclin (FAS1) repeats